ncbi:MAG TPA: dihydrofolate reductase family protein [Ktedonobacterales bacterium]|nr:dihydrofolate reductase family protein [Ktedonobacterales bacterium]
MGKVLWHITMSLDGFIAGPGDAMDWIFSYVGPNSAVDEVISTTGSVLSGRHSYNVGRRPDQPPEARKVFGGAWSGPVFVLTYDAPRDEEDPTITFLSGDIRAAIATTLGAAGGKNVVIIGANVARQCVDAGLVDEILVHLAPLLLGDGVRLFGNPGATSVPLEPLSVTQAGQVTNLRFRVVK